MITYQPVKNWDRRQKSPRPDVSCCALILWFMQQLSKQPRIPDKVSIDGQNKCFAKQPIHNSALSFFLVFTQNSALRKTYKGDYLCCKVMKPKLNSASEQVLEASPNTKIQILVLNSFQSSPIRVTPCPTEHHEN